MANKETKDSKYYTIDSIYLTVKISIKDSLSISYDMDSIDITDITDTTSSINIIDSMYNLHTTVSIESIDIIDSIQSLGVTSLIV